MYKTNDKSIDEKIAYLKQPYISALIVESCKEHIQKLKDEQTQATQLLSSGSSRQKWRAGKLDDVSALLMDYIDKYARCL